MPKRKPQRKLKPKENSLSAEGAEKLAESEVSSMAKNTQQFYSTVKAEQVDKHEKAKKFEFEHHIDNKQLVSQIRQVASELAKKKNAKRITMQLQSFNDICTKATELLEKQAEDLKHIAASNAVADPDDGNGPFRLVKHKKNKRKAMPMAMLTQVAVNDKFNIFNTKSINKNINRNKFKILSKLLDDTEAIAAQTPNAEMHKNNKLYVGPEIDLEYEKKHPVLTGPKGFTYAEACLINLKLKVSQTVEVPKPRSSSQTNESNFVILSTTGAAKTRGLQRKLNNEDDNVMSNLTTVDESVCKADSAVESLNISESNNANIFAQESFETAEPKQICNQDEYKPLIKTDSKDINILATATVEIVESQQICTQDELKPLIKTESKNCDQDEYKPLIKTESSDTNILAAETVEIVESQQICTQDEHKLLIKRESKNCDQDVYKPLINTESTDINILAAETVEIVESQQICTQDEHKPTESNDTNILVKEIVNTLDTAKTQRICVEENNILGTEKFESWETADYEQTCIHLKHVADDIASKDAKNSFAGAACEGKGNEFDF